MSNYKLAQEQKLLQKLSPLQIQYLWMLHLPILQLEDHLKNELELNPLLEEVSTKSDDNEPIDNSLKEKNENNLTVEDLIEQEETEYREKKITNSQSEYWEAPKIENISFLDQIYAQLEFSNLTEKELLIASEVLGNIDDDGYLRRDLILIINDITLRNSITVSFSEAEKVLFHIQRSEPIAIGARDLKECLLVQLEFSKANQSIIKIARDIIEREYDNFSKKHYEVIAKKLNVTMQKIKEAITLISHLNPKPGEGKISDENIYIVPDFYIQNNDGELIINLNNRNIPPLRVNQEYKNILLDQKKPNKEAKDFIRSKIESAKNFIMAIKQRQETMLQIMGTIVEKQNNFFLNGGEIHPLVYNDISKIIRKDKSTISRAIHNKYVQTDFGIFPLRYFFSERISTDNGEDVSNKEVKNILQQHINSEDPNNPLNDDELRQILKNKGIEIARRTVAKYREKLKIPVARLRRKI